MSFLTRAGLGIISICIILFSNSCKEEDEILYLEKDKTIKVSDNVIVDNGINSQKPIFNFISYGSFLKNISNSDYFEIVPLKEFKQTNPKDKVVISIRYDVDYHIDAAIKMAYRSAKYGIRSSFHILHSADYYGQFQDNTFVRNPHLIEYLKYIQNNCGQEVGFHNDLLTLQIVREMSPRKFLKDELDFLRNNGINIVGTSYHGSNYCYIYKYYNAYFWKEYPKGGWNYEYVDKGSQKVIFEKDNLPNYGFEYEGGLMNPDYFFTDVNFEKGKRWHMGMVNLDTIKPGKKVIILLHPNQWE